MKTQKGKVNPRSGFTTAIPSAKTRRNATSVDYGVYSKHRLQREYQNPPFIFHHVSSLAISLILSIPAVQSITSP
jgi:hypothetical protein